MKTTIGNTATAALTANAENNDTTTLNEQNCDVYTKPVEIEKGALKIALESAKGVFQREILEGYHFLSMTGQKWGASNAQSYANLFARLQADTRIFAREIRGKRNLRTLVITLSLNGGVK